MSINDDRVLRTMRAMAWERAKGELRSIGQTYWDGTSDRYDRFKEEIEEFIKRIEDEGIIE
jgi:hypothetical protein